MQGLGGALDVAIHLTHELHDIVESNRNPILSTHSDQQTPATRPAVFGVRACFAERRRPRRVNQEDPPTCRAEEIGLNRSADFAAACPSQQRAVGAR